VTLAARQVVLRDLLGVQFVVLENMEKAAPNVISDSIERGVTTERRMRPSVFSVPLDFIKTPRDKRHVCHAVPVPQMTSRAAKIVLFVKKNTFPM
jgi:hypothetical protein